MNKLWFSCGGKEKTDLYLEEMEAITSKSEEEGGFKRTCEYVEKQIICVSMN